MRMGLKWTLKRVSTAAGTCSESVRRASTMASSAPSSEETAHVAPSGMADAMFWLSIMRSLSGCPVASLTMNPRVGVTDEARNCISNVREGGLSITEGVRKLGYLVEEAFRLGLSGVGLKDRMAEGYLPFGKPIPELAGK